MEKKEKSGMGFNDFVLREPRVLPIFILADVSGSMAGEKINELNLSIREMVHTLNQVEDIRGKFQVSIITFGGDVKVLQPLSDIDGLEIQELKAGGNTPMGKAFEVVASIIEDREQVPSSAYIPTIVLISDGLPTDCPEEICKNKNYLVWEPLAKLHKGTRCAKAQRLALGIGIDADFDMLKDYVNCPEIPVIKATDISGITKFFQWVTMTTIVRINSVNPNEVATVAPIFDMDAEEVII